MRHRRSLRLDRRGRWIAAGTAVAVMVLGGIALLDRGPGIVIPDHPCANPPPLRTSDGVRLQPLALRAFRKAEAQAHTAISITASYRSCASQAMACRNI